MSTVGQKVRSAIGEEALEWFVRNRDAELHPEERMAFGSWLRLSSLHVEEYLKVAVVSRDMSAALKTVELDVDALLRDARAAIDATVVPLGHPEDPGTIPREPRAFWKKRMSVAAGIATASLALIAVLWFQRDGQRFGLPREFTTKRGEQRSWLLPDGTGLDLNSDSSIVVYFNAHERLVRIARGQALFHVAHEKARRFRVAAGDIAVVAVGTEFEVWRKSASTVVTVLQGTVAVFAGSAPPATDPASLPSQALAVGGGERVRVDDNSKVAESSRVNVQLEESWVQHRIAFDQQPLGQVADRFNEFSSVRIIIDSQRLRAIPITGVFSAYDTESFIAFLERLDGVQISRSGTQVFVIDGTNAKPPESVR